MSLLCTRHSAARQMSNLSRRTTAMTATTSRLLVAALHTRAISNVQRYSKSQSYTTPSTHLISIRAFSTPTHAPQSNAPATVAPAKVNKWTWTHIKGVIISEAKHYWMGTKLLAADVRVAYGLIKQVLGGHELTRRERKQLLRTSADMFRLIPFAVIVIIPFMEFSLPILLKLFPNMLPSTYIDHTGEEAKMKKQLGAKIEMAQFLQETTALMAAQMLESKGDDPQGQAVKFKAFMDKIRSGASVTNKEILEFSPLFDEELTLDHLQKNQLTAMCKLLDIKPFGSDWVLRYKLKQKLRVLKEDDEVIDEEGVDTLTFQELQEACRARGIHPGQSADYMRRKLLSWLELSLHTEVPTSLLVLSRAFSHTMTFNPKADLANTLAYIPEAVVKDLEQVIVDRSQDNAAKLELLEEESKVTSSEKKVKLAIQPAVGLRESKAKVEHCSDCHQPT